jgi:phosphoribosylaminoimidazole-succinocarboxamide synthase
MFNKVISETDFQFPKQTGLYRGKVRDVYDLGDSLLFVATDRYSAFDRNLSVIPHKGELLTATSKWWFEQTKHIVANHVIGYPDPNVTWGKKYNVVPIEMVVRGYITGVTNTSLWHTYSEGQRDYGDFTLPDGLHKNQKLPRPVLTPTTKFETHDRNLAPKEAVAEGLVSLKVWEQLQEIVLTLFAFGQETAAQKGLILVDTKYEFGTDTDGNVILIDEIHTQDSSRYWRADTYQASIDAEEEPDNYDKEYLRLWFKARFDPYTDTTPPTPDASVINELTNRYIYVYEHLTGKKFTPATDTDPLERIERHILKALAKQTN